MHYCIWFSGMRQVPYKSDFAIGKLNNSPQKITRTTLLEYTFTVGSPVEARDEIPKCLFLTFAKDDWHHSAFAKDKLDKFFAVDFLLNAKCSAQSISQNHKYPLFF